MIEYKLEGRIAIVTGASAGLGEQFCHAFAHSGADVVLAARRYELLEKNAEEISKQYGVRTLPIRTDVTVESDIIRLVEEANNEFGTVDVLVNNAGMYISKPLIEQTLDDWYQVIDVNLTSAFLGAREVAKVMIPKKRGCIINMASTFAFGATTFPVVGYYAAKGAIVMLTKALAVELGSHNIRVNAISPGFFPTNQSADAFKSEEIRTSLIEPRTALPMFAENEWIRGAACFLASDDAKYITGQTLAVDGGWLAF